MDWNRRLGFAYRLQGEQAAVHDDWDVAILNFEKSLNVRAKLADANPDNDGLRSEVASVHAWLGRCYRESGARTVALEHYETSYEIRNDLADSSPDSPGRQIDLVQSQAKLAVWHLAQHSHADDLKAVQWLDEAERTLDSMEEFGLCAARSRDCGRMRENVDNNREKAEKRLSKHKRSNSESL